MLGIGREKAKLLQINSASVKGEPGTGFEKRKQGGKSGPFECSNCEHFKNGNACDQKDMMKNSKEPKHPNGTIKVSGLDCCDYIERVK